MRKNEQNVVLNESLEELVNRSEIVWILMLAMTTVVMARAEAILSAKLVARFRLF